MLSPVLRSFLTPLLKLQEQILIHTMAIAKTVILFIQIVLTLNNCESTAELFSCHPRKRGILIKPVVFNIWQYFFAELINVVFVLSAKHTVVIVLCPDNYNRTV